MSEYSLTDLQTLECKLMSDEGYTNRAIGEHFDCSAETVSKALRREKFMKHLSAGHEPTVSKATEWNDTLLRKWV
jgi:hypothetical protein